MKNIFIATAFIVAVSLFAVVLAAFKGGTKEKTYTIVSQNQTYKTDSFRLYGKGVIFNTEDKEVIVMGDFQIIKSLPKND